MAPANGYWDCTSADGVFILNETATAGTTIQLRGYNIVPSWLKPAESFKELSRRLRIYMRSLGAVPALEPLESLSRAFKQRPTACSRHGTAMSMSQKSKEKRKKWLQSLRKETK